MSDRTIGPIAGSALEGLGITFIHRPTHSSAAGGQRSPLFYSEGPIETSPERAARRSAASRFPTPSFP
jgi:hypothetical protein